MKQRSFVCTRILPMDFLKVEIANKRKAVGEDAPHPSKYMRRGELEKFKAEEERKQSEQAEKAATVTTTVRACATSILANSVNTAASCVCFCLACT